MPRETRGAIAPTAPVTAETRMTLAIPDDVRADLLRAQQEDLGDNAKLTQVKVMGAGAGLFEFKDQSVEPTRTFRGVILNSHDRNVLWDKPVDDAAPAREGDEKNLPACASANGKQGVPRQGFAHAALQVAGQTPVRATGNEVIECGGCPYNQFGTGQMFNPRGNQRGKAVTNQKSIYILVPDRETPVELVITPSSLTAYNDYIASLLNQGIPVQAVETEFSQEVKQRAGSAQRWGVVIFRRGEFLDQAQFSHVLAARSRYARQIMPAEILVEATVEDARTERAQEGRAPTDDPTPAAAEEEIPF